MYKHIVTNLRIWIAKPTQLLLHDKALPSSEETLHRTRLQSRGCARDDPTPFVHRQPGGFGGASPVAGLFGIPKELKRKKKISYFDSRSSIKGTKITRYFCNLQAEPSNMEPGVYSCLG